MKLCQGIDAEIYKLLFDIESYLRLYVRWNLRKSNPNDWESKVGNDFVDQAKERQNQEIELGYLDDRKSGCLSYLNLSELKDIILGPIWPNSDCNWPSKEILHTEFKKLLGIRNKAAHFRPITSRDSRVAIRFSEDLVEWTRAYKTRRKRGKTTLDGCDALVPMDKYVPGIKKFWEENDDISSYLTMCDGHISVSAVVDGGSFDPDMFQDYINKYDKIITFIRVDQAGQNISPSFSIKSDPKKIISAVNSLLEMRAVLVDTLSSDEARDAYSMSSHEAVLPWEVELPANFSLTR